MSNKNQEVVVYFIDEKDLDKPISDRTVICVNSTVPPFGQQMEKEIVDEIMKANPPPEDSTEEEKQAIRDMIYMQSISFRALSGLTSQMPGNYLTLRMAIIAGPMAGTVIYNEAYPTHVDPAEIQKMEGGMSLKAEYAGKFH